MPCHLKTPRSVFPFLLAGFCGSVAFSCGHSERNETKGALASSEVVDLFHSECAEPARAAITALMNGLSPSALQFKSFRTVSAHSDREFFAVKVLRADRAETIAVNAETRGGSDCQIYGVQWTSEEIDLSSDEPSPGFEDHSLEAEPANGECGAPAIALAQALRSASGQSALGTVRFRTLAAHSDRELFELRFEGDSYIVNAETMGGSDCQVYGLQLLSKAIDIRLGDDAVSEGNGH